MGRRGWSVPREPCHGEVKLEERSVEQGRCGKAQGGWGLEEAATSFTLEKLARMGRRGCGI